MRARGEGEGEGLRVLCFGRRFPRGATAPLRQRSIPSGGRRKDDLWAGSVCGLLRDVTRPIGVQWGGRPGPPWGRVHGPVSSRPAPMVSSARSYSSLIAAPIWGAAQGKDSLGRPITSHVVVFRFLCILIRRDCFLVSRFFSCFPFSVWFSSRFIFFFLQFFHFSMNSFKILTTFEIK
jgi:hypothetical protein